MKPIRTKLPRPINRLALGDSGLAVSPVCIGMTGDPDVITTAFDLGINFFFLSADLHWPLYQGARDGLQALLGRPGFDRRDVVVAVTSYLDEPLFKHLQYGEVLGSVPGLDRVDVVVAGGVSDAMGFEKRLPALLNAKAAVRHGCRAVGASFHCRESAARSVASGCLDLQFVRYNSGHPGARYDLFPHLDPGRKSLVFNFKSLLFPVTAERLIELGLGLDTWLPEPTDYYRFALSAPQLDGVLCSPMNVREVRQLADALQQPPLTEGEQEHMMWLSAIGTPSVFDDRGAVSTLELPKKR
jgi:hypothetical protein